MWLLEGIFNEVVQLLPKPVRTGCYTLMVVFLIGIAAPATIAS